MHLHTVKYFQVLICITNNSIKYLSFVYTLSNGQKVLFQTIQFSITHFAHSLNVKMFYLIHRWDPIRCSTPSQSGPESNGNEVVLHIPQSSRTGVSSSDCLVSYPGHFVFGGGRVLHLSRNAVDWAVK